MLLFIGKTQINIFNIGGNSVKYDEVQCPNCKAFLVRDFLSDNIISVGKHAIQSKLCFCGITYQFECVDSINKNYIYNIFQIREL